MLVDLLTLPLAPIRGTAWVAEQVLTEAERQYYDPAAIRRQLDHVARARDAGEIGEDEADALERDLVARLIQGRHRG